MVGGGVKRSDGDEENKQSLSGKSSKNKNGTKKKSSKRKGKSENDKKDKENCGAPEQKGTVMKGCQGMKE